VEAIAGSKCGSDWTVHNSGTSKALYGICWSGTQYIAVGEKYTILSSSDGIHWEDHSVITPDSFYIDLKNVIWNGAIYVAVGFRIAATWGLPFLIPQME
jgi:hypothetical protein